MPKSLAALILSVITFAVTPTINAQVVVADPTNIAVNIEQLLKHLELLRRVDAQIRNQVLMLQNWEFTRLDEMLNEAKQISEVFEAAAVYRTDDPRRRIDRVYPIEPSRSAESIGLLDPSVVRATWMQQQRDALVQARTIQNRAFAAMPTTTERVEEYLERSSASPGPTAAAQAGNELLGTLVGQFQTLEALEITAAREALEREAARQAEEARTRFRRELLMRDWPKSPRDVRYKWNS